MHFIVLGITIIVTWSIYSLILYLIKRDEAKRKAFDKDVYDQKLQTINNEARFTYELLYSPSANLYVAGCRLFTPKQALKHWRAAAHQSKLTESYMRIDRARAFVKAIEEHQLSLKGDKK